MCFVINVNAPNHIFIDHFICFCFLKQLVLAIRARFRVGVNKFQWTRGIRFGDTRRFNTCGDGQMMTLISSNPTPPTPQTNSSHLSVSGRAPKGNSFEPTPVFQVRTVSFREGTKGEFLLSTPWWTGFGYINWPKITLRIQVCPKKGITPTFLFVSDGIGALNPLLGKVLDPFLSNEKNPGYLLYIGDYTTQLYGDYNTPF